MKETLGLILLGFAGSFVAFIVLTFLITRLISGDIYYWDKDDFVLPILISFLVIISGWGLYLIS